MLEIDATLVQDIAATASCKASDISVNYAIDYGSKSVSLSVDLVVLGMDDRWWEATTYVKTVGTDADRLPQETTVLYAAVCLLVQQHADALQAAILYEFSTRNPRMVAWAESTGQQIFDWQPSPDGGTAERPAFAAKKTFMPAPPAECTIDEAAMLNG